MIAAQATLHSPKEPAQPKAPLDHIFRQFSTAFGFFFIISSSSLKHHQNALDLSICGSLHSTKVMQTQGGRGSLSSSPGGRLKCTSSCSCLVNLSVHEGKIPSTWQISYHLCQVAPSAVRLSRKAGKSASMEAGLAMSGSSTSAACAPLGSV